MIMVHHVRCTILNQSAKRSAMKASGAPYAWFHWWACLDSNQEPDRYERPALTIELQAPPRAAARGGRQRCRHRLQGRPRSGNHWRQCFQPVIAGPDPAIRLLKRTLTKLDGCPDQARAPNVWQAFASI